MKPVYSNVDLKPGAHNGGIITIQVAAKEWLSSDPVISFMSGKVTTAITLLEGFNWLTLEFTPGSYTYDEKPKQSKPGTYYEVTAAGIINYSDPDLQQVLQTLRYHQVVAIVTNRNKFRKVVGNTEYGMIPQIGNIITNAASGKEYAEFSLLAQTEASPPFYEI